MKHQHYRKYWTTFANIDQDCIEIRANLGEKSGAELPARYGPQPEAEGGGNGRRLRCVPAVRGEAVDRRLVTGALCRWLQYSELLFLFCLHVRCVGVGLLAGSLGCFPVFLLVVLLSVLLQRRAPSGQTF